MIPAALLLMLAQPDFFSQKLYPILEKAQCRACHATDGVASGTRLHFPEAGAARERIETFGVSLGVLGELLANKPTNRIKHTGGERIKQDSPEEKILLEWVKRLAALPPAEIAAAARRLSQSASASADGHLLRRLTHSQYNNTVRDLLGDYSRPADLFPREDFVDGFQNQLRTQTIPPLLAEMYSNAAEKLALNAFRAGDVHNLLPCQSGAKCRDEFVRGFGLRAFRRPLTDAEFRRYVTLFDAQSGTSGKFLDGARVVVEAMLQSPKFLFRNEGLPDYAIASRLSYFLWNTTPDKGLLDAVVRGDLRSTAGIARTARRMLDDPRAHEALDEFFTEWLRFDRTLTAVKDGRKHPQFTPELAAMMVEETRRLLHHLVSSDGNFMEAFSADYSFLNSELAALYKLPAPAGEFELVRFPAGSHRAGILGQGSFLASTAGPVETSPTARGIFIREQLLCQHVPSPPPGVNTTLPDPTIDQPLTKRQLMVAHATNPTCAGCHRLMDPIGFGLENFDAIGRWRDAETIEARSADLKKVVKRIDLPLDPAGEVAGIASSAFTDPRQLGVLLAATPVCQECVVRQVFRYALGRMETEADEPEIRRIFAAFRDSGFHFKEVLLGVVRSPQFGEGLTRRNQ